MSELDSQARAIIEAGRDADQPSLADHTRIKHAIAAQIASGVLASAAVAGGTSAGLKVGLAVLAISAVGGGAVGVVAVSRHHTSGTSHPARTVEKAAGLAPRPVPTPALQRVDETRPVSPSVETRVQRAERTRHAAVPVWSSPGRSRSDLEPKPEPTDDRLNAEVATLNRAREALRLGRPTQALEALHDYDRRFGRGTLNEERQALEVIATCLARPGASARAAAESFLRTSPTSPMIDRVRAACITPGHHSAR